MIMSSAKRKEEAAEALVAARQPDLRVLRRLPTTRYCAYASVLPQLVAHCQCWRCLDRRGAPRAKIEIRLDTRKLQAGIQSAIEALGALETNAKEVSHV